ncbi:hypothetical protein M3699_22705 [Peribacillus simplex]|uniref:hypothetical protein n=1 Tax=Peribacillus simplex TaxID=1478 RepID=UPI0020409807|nr:hypothetical protein [Peribacillus simplex]MCM3676581.1 hypothetical protein [Peribacillus simplex]
MLKQIRALEDKQLLRCLWWNTGTFAVVFLLLCYLAGDHDYMSFQTAVMILIVVYIPGLLLMLAMYVKADAETRKAYNIRIGLVAAYGVITIVWRYLN